MYHSRSRNLLNSCSKLLNNRSAELVQGRPSQPISLRFLEKEKYKNGIRPQFRGRWKRKNIIVYFVGGWVRQKDRFVADFLAVGAEVNEINDTNVRKRCLVCLFRCLDFSNLL